MTAARMWRRMAGRLGDGGGPAPVSSPMLFPPKPQMLQEREGELAQQRMVMQAMPGTTLEVIEPELFLHLLVHLLADPASLDQACQDFQRRAARVIGQVMLSLAIGAVLPD